MRIVAFLVASLLTIRISQAQLPNWTWTDGSQSDGSEYINDIAVDASGHNIVVGTFYGDSLTIGSTTLLSPDPSTNYSFLILISYDITGNVQWFKWLMGCEGNSVSTDAANNIYVTGNVRHELVVFADDTLQNTGSSNIILLKFDPSGNAIWGRSPVSSTGFNLGVDVLVNSSQDIYVTGSYTSNTITFGNTALYDSSDVFLVKYNPVGDVLWALAFGGSEAARGFSLAEDLSGNIYLTGFFYSAVMVVGTDTLQNVGNSDTDIFISKFDGQGNVIWARSAGGASGDIGRSVICDPNGNVYMTGTFSGTAVFGTTPVTSASPFDYDMFLAKYDNNGDLLSVQTNGGSSNDVAHSMSSDSDGNIYQSGYFQSDTIAFDSYTLANTSSGKDAFIAKYDVAGNVVWACSFGGDGNDVIKSITNDNDGNVLTCGEFFSDTLILGVDVYHNYNSQSIYPNMFVGKVAGVVNGISSFNNPSVTLFPNPTNATVAITGLPFDKWSLHIVNSVGAGSTIASFSGTETTLNFAPLPSGLYLIRMSGDSGNAFATKLVKE